jgi:uncharacterized membrane protein (DUF2068 family)
MQVPPGVHLAPRPRPRRKVDWELISCGLEGHYLIGTDAGALRPEDAALAREQDGLRWHRCLRCDSWVAVHVPTSPEREFPPQREEIDIPMRGKALRDRFVLRLIAVDRVVHFLVLGILGIAVLVFAAHENALRGTFYRVMAALQGGVGGGPVQSSRHVGIIGELDKLFSLQSGHLTDLGIVLLAYAALEGVEAVGLWRGRRWAEYLTFVATTVLLIPEVYELSHKISALKIIGLIINLAVVVYLLFAKRLFGLRGGGPAEERERRRDMTWEAIERATPAGVVPATS